MKFLRTASYTTLLYIAVFLLMLLSAGLLFISNTISVKANHEVWFTSSAYQQELMNIQHVQSNLLKARALFDENAQKPRIEVRQVIAVFRATLIKSSQLDVKIGTDYSTSIRLAFSAFYNVAQSLKIEERNSDSVESGYELVLGNLEQVLNSNTFTHPETLAVSNFKIQLRNLYLMCQRQIDAPPLTSMRFAHCCQTALGEVRRVRLV